MYAIELSIIYVLDGCGGLFQAVSDQVTSCHDVQGEECAQ